VSKTEILKRVLVVLGLGLCLGALHGGSLLAEPLPDAPIVDTALDKRLTTTNTYKARQGDTLVGVANLLYGHKTWWLKLQQRNPGLAGKGPNDPLEPGTKIRYRAPKLGDTYVVQPNDWLVRIVEWKYGAHERWEQVFRQNAHQISDPNLIHPGDRLILSADGTVSNVNTGKVLMTGESELQKAVQDFLASSPPRITDPEPPLRMPSAVAPQQELMLFGLSQPQAIALGFGVGLLMMLMTPLLWLLRKPALVGPSERPTPVYDSGESARDHGPIEQKASVKRAEDRQGFPYTFKKRKDQYDLDRSLILPEDGEVDRRPNYHSLRSKKKKSMKSR